MNVAIIFLLVTFVAFANSAHIQQFSNSHPIRHRDDITSLLKEKCDQNSGNENAFFELVNAAQSLSECSLATMTDLHPSPIFDYNEYCKHLKNGDSYKCLENFSKKVEPCLDADESYLINFLLTSFNASVIEVCGPNGFETVSALANDIDSSTCFQTSSSALAIKDKCLPSLKLYKNILNDNISIKKEDLCSDLRSIQTCAADTLRQECNEDHSEMINLILNPYLVACDQ